MLIRLILPCIISFIYIFIYLDNTVTRDFRLTIVEKIINTLINQILFFHTGSNLKLVLFLSYQIVMQKY